jgi:hypothetical protein
MIYVSYYLIPFFPSPRDNTRAQKNNDADAVYEGHIKTGMIRVSQDPGGKVGGTEVV